MNVTPLVDVVLVLLIIFMVVTPLLSKQFWVHTPRQQKEESRARSSRRTRPRPSCSGRRRPHRHRHGTDVAVDELVDRLRRMFAARDDHVIFFDATTRPSTASASR